MKHFGIWCVEPATWLVNSEGEIFWTTSKAVAEAMLAKCNGALRQLEIREFIDIEEPKPQ